MHKLSDQIYKLTEAIDQISLENRKLTGGLVITKNVNSRLEERIITLEKNQHEEDFENTVINIFKKSGIDVDTRDIEVCHRLLLSRNSRGHSKRVIITFLNRKYAEAMLKDKKRISGKNFGHLYVTNKTFVSVSLCPYYRYI